MGYGSVSSSCDPSLKGCSARVSEARDAGLWTARPEWRALYAILATAGATHSSHLRGAEGTIGCDSPRRGWHLFGEPRRFVGYPGEEFGRRPANARCLVRTRRPASEVLTVGEMDAPRPGPGEVLVRMRASGVNPGEVKRLMFPSPFPRVR